MVATNDRANVNGSAATGTWTVKKGLAQMLKGGVIMDVVTPEQAKIAEEAGACAVMALERVPADIRADGRRRPHVRPGRSSRASSNASPSRSWPRRASATSSRRRCSRRSASTTSTSREVLTPADEANHIDKHQFKVPFVCGCRNLGEALRRIGEGAAMIRTKGEAGTGNIVEAVRHMRAVWDDIRRLQGMREDELFAAAKELQAPLDLVKDVAATRQAARRELRRRRHRHARRRRADDAARRRGRLRRLRHLQVGGPGAHGEGHRQGDDALPGRADHRRGLARKSASRCAASRSAPSRSRRSCRSAGGEGFDPSTSCHLLPFGFDFEAEFRGQSHFSFFRSLRGTARRPSLTSCVAPIWDCQRAREGTHVSRHGGVATARTLAACRSRRLVRATH